MKKYVFSFLFAALVVFWIIPWVGHKILMADDYYTMKRHEVYTSKTVNCSEIVYEKIYGNFLFIYSYSAAITKSCVRDQKTRVLDKYLIVIKAERPHTIIADIFSLNPPEVDMIPLKNIYSERREING